MRLHQLRHLSRLERSISLREEVPFSGSARALRKRFVPPLRGPEVCTRKKRTLERVLSLAGSSLGARPCKNSTPKSSSLQGRSVQKKKRQKTFKNANAMQRRDRGPIPVGKNSALTLRRSGLRRCVCCDANSTRWIARPPSTSQCYKSIKIVPFQQHRKRMYRLPTLLHRIESTTQP